MKLQIVGCSHHNSSVEIRQRLAFRSDQVAPALDRLCQQFPNTEAVVLSTCNRVEVYTATDDHVAGPSHQEVVHFLADFHQVDPSAIFDDLFERTGEDAVRHLFYVAASLDSMVVGEAQILGQVKQAYEQATQLGTTGPLTHAIFQAALKAARRVAAETTINQRRVSIPAIAVTEFSKRIFDRFDDKQVLLIGAGEMAGETMRYLRDEGARNVTIINRSRERSEALAHDWDGRVVDWDTLPAQLTQADLIVSTTASPEPVVTLADFQAIEPMRYQRSLAILDLAVPRDFEPAVGDCLGVYLTGIDDLGEACTRNRRAREKEWPAAERIIEEETDRFMTDLNHRATAPTIRRLRETCESLKNDELQRLFHKLQDVDEPIRQEIERSFDRLVNKMLHPPLESLRDEARQGTPHALVEALKRLFQLKD